MYRESRWNTRAVNRSNGRYGLGQFLHYRNPDPIAQLRRMLRYIDHRYGSPCKAWAYWRRHGWY